MNGNNVNTDPEIGQAVQIRNRLAVIKSIKTFGLSNTQGATNLVDVEYLDERHHPQTDTVLWEIESSARIIGTSSLPNVLEKSPDSPDVLRAFINANRWSRLNRLRTQANVEEEPLLSVWSSAIQVHGYQLEPVIRALEMPRVSMLLADGVGLGKTIQAGLILQELMLRRRIRRVLIVCPAMLQRQWQSELKRKFNLDFEIIDLEGTYDIKRKLGVDVNPWKAFPHIITSMDYLRSPDIKQQFKTASSAGTSSEADSINPPTAPWDMLIVDEAHNFAPQNSRRYNQRYRMLQEIRFLFEHRIFLTATPHNGKTISFTGLLELLDPVRFQIQARMDENDRTSLEEIKVRRLKSDICKHTFSAPFTDKIDVSEIPVGLDEKELEVYHAFRAYRKEVQKRLQQSGDAGKRWVGHFVFSVLTKRLLSSPHAFALTWQRHISRDRTEEDADAFTLTKNASTKAEETIQNDHERLNAEVDVVSYGGRWLDQCSLGMETVRDRVTNALTKLGISSGDDDGLFREHTDANLVDSKTDELVKWVKANLFNGRGKLRDDERLIIFTEYKETLEYLQKRFLKEGFDNNTLKMLYGGMRGEEFRSIQSEFEAEDAQVRLLLATDAASEGINMQNECRWVIHYDIPWSPTKLQQRNGRIWRHGQMRDVEVRYFRCDQDEDLDFLAKVAKKVENVREDLGSVEKVFIDAVHNHFQGKDEVFNTLQSDLLTTRTESFESQDLMAFDGDLIQSSSQRANRMLENTQDKLNISPGAVKSILTTASVIEGGVLEPVSANPGFFRLKSPPAWESVVKESLTTSKGSHRIEVFFDESLVTKDFDGRRLFKPKRNQDLLRLGHPVMQRALSTLRRQLYDPSGSNAIWRWTIAALDRSGFDALMIFHYTLTVTNELREPLHDETVSTVFRVDGNSLQSVESNFEHSVLNQRLVSIGSSDRLESLRRKLIPLWDSGDVGGHRVWLENYMSQIQKDRQLEFVAKAKEALTENKKAAKSAYQYRIKALEKRSEEKEYEKIARELNRAEAAEAQATMFADQQQETAQSLEELMNMMELIKVNINVTKEKLENELDNRLNNILPARYNIQSVRVLPLAVEYVVPVTAEELTS